MFAGWYAVSLDEKGRVAVPASFRHLLTKNDGGPLYLTPHLADGKPRIQVYPAAKFIQLAEQIEAMDDQDQAELLKDGLIGRAVAVELDGQGRIVLPQWLREEGGLHNGRVAVVGQIGRFDIWDESRYHTRHDNTDPDRLKQALKLIKR